MKQVFLVYVLFLSLSKGVSQEKSFIRYKLDQVGYILVSKDMELQGGDMRKVADAYYQQITGVPFTDRIVFQQSGFNDLKEEARGKYVRIIIITKTGSKGDFPRLSDDIVHTSTELTKKNNSVKAMAESSISKMGGTILTWSGPIVKKINKQNAVKFSYTRKMGVNTTKVDIYYFQNYDREYKVNLEYWVKDEKFWKPLLEKSINSFQITHNQ